jgi:hypothetical protein
MRHQAVPYALCTPSPHYFGHDHPSHHVLIAHYLVTRLLPAKLQYPANHVWVSVSRCLVSNACYISLCIPAQFATHLHTFPLFRESMSTTDSVMAH